MCYFRLGRLSRNNRPPKSHVKKGKKVNKGQVDKDKADKGSVLTDDPEYMDKWLRWQFSYQPGSCILFNHVNKIKYGK